MGYKRAYSDAFTNQPSKRRRTNSIGRRRVISKRRKIFRLHKKRSSRLMRIPKSKISIKSFLPAKKWCYMDYVGTYAMGHPAVSSYFKTVGFDIRPNSVYDPCTGVLTTLDKSVNLYGLMSTYYNRYSVKWCKATFTLRQLDNASASPTGTILAFGVRKDNDQTLSLVTVNQAESSPAWSVKRWVTKSDELARPCTVSMFWSEKEIDANDRADNGAAPGYNPSASSCSIYLKPMIAVGYAGIATESVATDNMIVEVRLRMKVLWSDRKDLEQESTIMTTE